MVRSLYWLILAVFPFSNISAADSVSAANTTCNFDRNTEIAVDYEQFQFGEKFSRNSPNVDTLFTRLLPPHTTLIAESAPEGAIGESYGAGMRGMKLFPYSVVCSH